MSRINLQKPDKFYFLFIFVMLLTASFVIYTFNVIFNSINKANDIGAQFTEVELKIDKDRLDKALSAAEDKGGVELIIR